MLDEHFYRYICVHPIFLKINSCNMKLQLFVTLCVIKLASYEIVPTYPSTSSRWSAQLPTCLAVFGIMFIVNH